jgi:hypothetical protein
MYMLMCCFSVRMLHNALALHETRAHLGCNMHSKALSIQVISL